MDQVDAVVGVRRHGFSIYGFVGIVLFLVPCGLFNGLPLGVGRVVDVVVAFAVVLGGVAESMHPAVDGFTFPSDDCNVAVVVFGEDRRETRSVVRCRHAVVAWRDQDVVLSLDVRGHFYGRAGVGEGKALAVLDRVFLDHLE